MDSFFILTGVKGAVPNLMINLTKRGRIISQKREKTNDALDTNIKQQQQQQQKQPQTITSIQIHTLLCCVNERTNE